jgi:TonB family protein
VGSGKGGGFGPGEGGGVGGGVYRVGGGVTAPIVLTKKDPEYSEEARKAKYSGTVLLSIEVSPNGLASNIKVVRSLGLGLDEKAIEAVKQWKFKPGYKDGKPVTVAATIEVNFRLL